MHYVFSATRLAQMVYAIPQTAERNQISSSKSYLALIKDFNYLLSIGGC